MKKNEAVGPGEAGEVTITTLGVEAMPLLRYKTGDICMYVGALQLRPQYPSPFTRAGPQKANDKIQGHHLYPPALFDLLNEMEEVLDYVAEVYSNDIGHG